MIKKGEKITVELLGAYNGLLDAVKQLPNVLSAEVSGQTLTVNAEHGHSNLSSILAYLSSRNIAHGRVYCEPPTLNDVFLELTGKELRD